MPQLTCTVEMRYARFGQDELISGEFSGSSVFEAAWRAVFAWCRMWYYDPDSPIIVKQGDRVWRVSQQRIRDWRPLSDPSPDPNRMRTWLASGAK